LVIWRAGFHPTKKKMPVNGVQSTEAILSYFTADAGKSLLAKFDFLMAVAAPAIAQAKDAVEKVTEKVKEMAIEPKKESKPAPKKEEKPENDEDDIDLFGSDDDVDEEAEKVKQARIAEYAAKKSAKPAVIAKSQVVLDVKPWDDETDMAALEAGVRKIEMDGLVLGNSQLVAVGFGIKKLQISCVVEDAKVSVDELIEKITEDEDHVQSVDVAAFNKL